MSDEVGVSPERVARLAAVLENLRDVLAANVPVIVNTMNGYWSSGTGQPVSLSPLQQAVARSVPDAADMRARANLAAAFMANPANIDIVTSGLAWIPWSGPPLDNADAQLDAHALKAAVAGAAKDPAAARAAIAAIAKDIRDHSSDEEFLTAFWSQPGVNAAAAAMASVLRTTDDGHTVKAPGKSDLDNVLAIAASAAVPLGFRGASQYMSFAKNLRIGLIRAGYPDATATFRGSSVTGVRYSTGEPVGDNPGDYDLAVADPDLFNAAKALGVPLRGGGTRTAVLNNFQIDELGLSELQEQLNQQAGRKVSFMVYQDEDAIAARGPYMTVPDGQEIVNYYDKQAKLASQDEANLEVEQIEQQEQPELAEEEAEAEAEAEAMAMADEDE